MTAVRSPWPWLALLLLTGCGGADRSSGEWFRPSAAAPDFLHHSGAGGRYELPEIMGGGAAWFDVDGDGSLEIYLVDGAGPNRLYRLDGQGVYREVADAAGLDDGGYGMGVAVGDVDSDGDPDLFLTNDGMDRLYLNDGGRFVDVSEIWGIAVDGWSTSTAFLDYDADGDLDLFIARYVRQARGKSCTDSIGRIDYCQPQMFAAATDVLLMNDGGRRFIDVSLDAGIAAGRAPGLGVVVDDWNGDGWPDLFVANDGAANHLWLNDGEGGFEEVALWWGVAYNLSGKAEAGMGVVSDDFDRDGRAEILVTHLAGETHTLYGQRGDSPRFEDLTLESGLAGSSRPSTGFGVASGDFDLDGDLDLAVANGRVTRRPETGDSEVGAIWAEFGERDQLWINRDGALTIVGEGAAPLGEVAGISRAMLAADHDDDGDLDLLRTSIEGPTELFENVRPRRGHWLRVTAKLALEQWHAPGVTIELRLENATLRRSTSNSAGYLSAGDGRAHFGIGAAASTANARLRVRWPGGLIEEFPVAGWDEDLTVVKGTGEKLK